MIRLSASTCSATHISNVSPSSVDTSLMMTLKTSKLSFTLHPGCGLRQVGEILLGSYHSVCRRWGAMVKAWMECWHTRPEENHRILIEGLGCRGERHPLMLTRTTQLWDLDCRSPPSLKKPRWLPYYLRPPTMCSLQPRIFNQHRCWYFNQGACPASE